MIGVGEEVLGSDEGSSEGGDTVERLRELKSDVRHRCRRDGRNVRIGGNLECGQTTSDDGGADDETTEDGARVGSSGKLGDWPEEDRTGRIEAETHDDSKLVTSSSEDFSCDGRESKVTDTKVSRLKTGGLSLGDVEDVSEVCVEDIKKTVGKTPQEEERGNEGESPEILSLDEAGLEDAAGLLSWYDSSTGHVE